MSQIQGLMAKLPAFPVKGMPTLPKLPPASALKTKEAGIIALASTGAMALGVTAISNRKSMQSGISSFFKKIEAKAKAVKKSVSDFVRSNPNAVKASALAVTAGIVVAGVAVKSHNKKKLIGEHLGKAFPSEARQELIQETCQQLSKDFVRAKVVHDFIPGLGTNEQVLAVAKQLGESFPGPQAPGILTQIKDIFAATLTFMCGKATSETPAVAAAPEPDELVIERFKEYAANLKLAQKLGIEPPSKLKAAAAPEAVAASSGSVARLKDALSVIKKKITPVAPVAPPVAPVAPADIKQINSAQARAS